MTKREEEIPVWDRMIPTARGDWNAIKFIQKTEAIKIEIGFPLRIPRWSLTGGGQRCVISFPNSPAVENPLSITRPSAAARMDRYISYRCRTIQVLIQTLVSQSIKWKYVKVISTDYLH